MGICYYSSSKVPYECRDSVNSASKTASLLFQPLFPSGTHSPAAAGAGAETHLPSSVTCERLWHVAIKGVLRSSQAAHSLDASSISASSFRGWCQAAAWRRVGRAMDSLGRCSRCLPWPFTICSEVRWSEVKLLSHVQLFVTPWTVAYQAPPSMGFSRQEYWSGVPLPSPVAVSFWHFQDSQRKHNMVRGHQKGKWPLCPHRH